MNAMLKTLKLQRYRGFESYQLTELTRVNLVVGKNNCGKTSILEAVELLVSGGSVTALRESAERRGEFHENLMDGVDVSHVFHGHRCMPGASFELSSPGSQHHLSGKVLSLDDVGETADRWEAMTKRRRPANSDEEPVAAFGLSLIHDGQELIMFPITENGTLLDRFRMHRLYNGRSQNAVHFLNLTPSSMQTAWNDVVSERRETEIVEAIRILMPEIDSIHFLAGHRRNGILVGQRDVKQRLPIGTYGDGMRRLLALSLAFAGTENGCLLIDEVDTGFHWTVIEDVWRLIVEAADRWNVQVFATTHSYDCIKGLGTLIQSRPDLALAVAVQKVHRSLEQAVCIPGDEIPIAVEQEIEVR